MDSATILANIADPAILFFLLGIVAAAVRSNLEIPAPISKFLSLYLLTAIGYKGGIALRASGFDAEVGRILLLSLLIALAIPAWSYLILRKRIDPFDAAAIAATYGSVSAVTFIAASSFLMRADIAFSGVMTVALVVMESPAIIMAVLLSAWVRSRQAQAAPIPVAVGAGVGAGGRSGDPIAGTEVLPPAAPKVNVAHLVRDALTEGPNMLLLGAMAVGFFSSAEGAEAMAPFTTGLFKGLLALFLLEMGLLVARELRQVRGIGPFLVGFGLLMPLVNASVAIAAAKLAGLGQGNAILLTVLAASASYIVVPAVVRYAIPEAKPSRYLGLALGITFPFNIVVGIPLYATVVAALW